MFVWGSALSTDVGRSVPSHLMELGFEGCGSENHTQGAVQARIEDEDRTEMFMDYAASYFPVQSVPYFGDRCSKVVKKLVKNFYRHPGTALFKKMETGAHSYMHMCHSMPK